MEREGRGQACGARVGANWRASARAEARCLVEFGCIINDGREEREKRDACVRVGARRWCAASRGISLGARCGGPDCRKTRRVGRVKVACRGIVLRQQGATEKERRDEAAVRCFTQGWCTEGVSRRA